MNALTNTQFINNEQGQPVFVIIPYADYLYNFKHQINIDEGVPSEVVNMVFDNGYSPAKAWREYLKVSQEEAAKKIGVSQAAYSQYEKSEKLRLSTRIKIANALNIKAELLDF